MVAGVAGVGLAGKAGFGQAAGAAVPSRTEIEALLARHFEFASPEMAKFTADVYEHCLLGRVQPAEPPIKHAWLIPGGGYIGQWIWDTTFLTDLLVILPGHEEFVRGVYQNYWDAQARLSAVKPGYARGLVPNFIAPDSGTTEFTGKTWKTFPGFSQAPLIAWGVERVYRRNHDLQLVRESLAGLEAFNEWYWRERDVEGVGLVTVGSYDGITQNARYETYDNEVDLDTLKLAPHPGRPAGPDNGPWYGDIYIPANTAYLLASEASLERLARAAGDTAMAARRKARHEKGIAAMREHMWDEEAGCFLAVRRKTMEKVLPATVGALVPLVSGVPTAAQAKRMAATVHTSAWATPLPLPSVDSHYKEYRSFGFWRGDVWPSTVYQTAAGLALYGEKEAAAEIAGKLLENALKVGVWEHYDSQSGAGLGVQNLGMSAVMLTMAIEGLSPRHRVTVKKA